MMFNRNIIPIILFISSSVISGYDFFITSQPGTFSEYFTSKNGTRFGMTFQNDIFATRESNTKIGTNQGYSIWFPKDEYMIENYNDTSESVDSLFKLPTRTFFLDDGTITAVNQAIVGATGVYSEYFGGELIEYAVGTDPYQAEITLVLPQQHNSAGNRRVVGVVSSFGVVLATSIAIIIGCE